MIRITRETDYGIVLLSRLASGSEPGVLTARYLATWAGLPYPMVSKILKALARAGLLASRRGAKGGYTLAYLPEEVSLGDVIEVLEGPIGITECARLPGSCVHEPVCPVRSRLQEISGTVREFLLGIPLSDLQCPVSVAVDPHRESGSGEHLLLVSREPVGDDRTAHQPGVTSGASSPRSKPTAYRPG